MPDFTASSVNVSVPSATVLLNTSYPPWMLYSEAQDRSVCVSILLEQQGADGIFGNLLILQVSYTCLYIGLVLPSHVNLI